jgi:hypothetical protein
MLLSRRADGSLGPADPDRRPGQAVLRLQGPVPNPRSARRDGGRSARRRNRRVSDRSRRRQRPVRDQFHLCRCAQVRGQFHLRQDGGERDRAQARHDRHLHAEAVLESHRQRCAFSRLARVRGAKERLSRSERQVRDGALDAGVPVPRRRAGACARLVRRRGADGELLQAPGRGPFAVGRDLGACLHRLRRQQSHRLRARSPTGASR